MVAVKLRELPTVFDTDAEEGEDKEIVGAGSASTVHIHLVWLVPFVFSAITVTLCSPTCAELLWYDAIVTEVLV